MSGVFAGPFGSPLGRGSSPGLRETVECPRLATRSHKNLCLRPAGYQPMPDINSPLAATHGRAAFTARIAGANVAVPALSVVPFWGASMGTWLRDVP